MENEIAEELDEELEDVPFFSGGQLKPKQQLAAKLIAEGYTQADAARDSRINVTKVTMHRWTKDPVFQRLVETLSTNTVLVIEGILSQGAEAAAQAIVDLAAGKLKYDDTSELNARVRAAFYIVDRILKKTKLPPARAPSRSQLPSAFEGDDEVESAIKSAGK